MERERKPVVKLQIAGQRRKRASVLLRWCLDNEAVEWLAEKKILDVFLLISVWDSKGKEVYRKIVDPADSQRFLTFRQPGRHVIGVALVWPDESQDETWFKKLWLLQEDGCYKMRVAMSGESGPVFYGATVLGGLWGTLVHHVDESLCAKQTFDWDWINLVFDDTPRDQLQLWRRRVWAYLFQWWIVFLISVIIVLARVVVGIVLIIEGCRDMNLWPILHPWDCDTGDMWGYKWKEDSFFQAKADGSSRPPIVPLLRPLMLIFYAGICLATGTFGEFPEDMFGIITIDDRLEWFLYIFGLIIFIVFLISVVARYLIELEAGAIQRSEEQEGAEEDGGLEEAVEGLYEELWGASCANPNVFTRKPQGWRARWHVIYIGIKARLFRPYATEA